MLIDIHAHYDDAAFDEDRDVCLRRAAGAGVERIINAATNSETIVKCLAFTRKYPDFYCVLGIHPEYADSYTPEMISQLETLSRTEQKVVGIGETGLDYHYLPKENPAECLRIKAAQKENFIAHIRLAERLGLPLTVHDRDAHQDTLQLLREHVSGRIAHVLHCYSGSAEMVRDFTALNFCFSVGGVLTFQNASRLAEALRAMPRERILLETDCPYLAPVPHRGRRNDSSLLVHTAHRMAELLGTSFDEICRMTTDNAFRVFGRLH